jgi:hypothetical protein
MNYNGLLSEKFCAGVENNISKPFNFTTNIDLYGKSIVVKTLGFSFVF